MKTIMVERRSRVNPEGANAGKEEGSGFGVQNFASKSVATCFSLQPSAFSLQPSAFIIHHSSFIIHHSSFIIHHSSFIIHHSSFCILHSAFCILHSAFCISPAHSTITVNPR
jgi:hypothetical protein